MNEFQDKVVLVTGAGRGIGEAIAVAFAKRGAVVAVNDINPDRASRTADQIRSAGGQAEEYLADVSKKMPVQAMINQIEDDWGHLDIVVNNAAVRPHKLVLEMDEWEWRRTLDVNLTGPFLIMQVAGRVMAARYAQSQAGGVIVNVGSTIGYAASGQGLGAYAASKVGLKALTAAAADELFLKGIRVHAICLGDVGNDAPNADTLPDNLEKVCSTILHLCSDGARHLNGQMVNC